MGMLLRSSAIQFFVGFLFLISHWIQPMPQAVSGALNVLGRDGSPISSLTDGDAIRLEVALADPAAQDTPISFFLEGQTVPVAECTVSAKQKGCQSQLFPALGWYWTAVLSTADDGQSTTQWQVRATAAVKSTAGGKDLPFSASVQVSPRPVVMVHGFSSSWQTWEKYLGTDGYLSSIGLHGFAVGDGQVPGEMNTGNIAHPAMRTNTIAENATILGQYIEGVKKATGAQQVDLLGYNIGGIISRYYIDRVMKERDVAQLIMLGTPQNGSDCANLPATLGLYLPATLEIRPSYMRDIFNLQVNHRHGVPFHAVAGTAIQDAISSPCNDIPNDLAVSLESATGIPLQGEQTPILHIDLNSSAQVFKSYIRPLLQTPAGNFKDEPDPALSQTEVTPLQFTRIYTGHVTVDASQSFPIPVDANVLVASFALFDASSSLTVTVQGASGNIIQLDPVKNGLVTVKDPSVLFNLGYGFKDPEPGPWRVTIQSTERTPAEGADFALTAHFTGGPILKAKTSTLLPKVGETVQLEARLESLSKPLPIESAQGTIRGPDGQTTSITLSAKGDQFQAIWKPTAIGLYTIDLMVNGKDSNGATVERTAFLALQAQPDDGNRPITESPFMKIQAALGIGILLVTIGWFLWKYVLQSRAMRRR